MRKRIQQLANGKFDNNGPKLSLSTEKIELEILEGKDETGSFVITSTNQVKMRGIIYSSNPRMECLTPQFEGEEVRIRYQFHSEGLIEGDIQKGEFFIVCNQGEYNLSFVVSVSRLYADSSLGKIKNLNDFAKLAKESYDEAYRLFYSSNFKNLIKEEKDRRLYEGLRTQPQSPLIVETFLTATHHKKKVEPAFEETEKAFYGVSGQRKEQLEIQKPQWGAVRIRVASDADFLIPGKQLITENDFIGSTCFFDYYIDADKMHAGRNFGRLCFELPEQSFVYTVTALQKEMREEEPVSDHREAERARAELMQLYIDYRLKRIVTGVWSKRSVELLDHLAILEPEDAMYRLMKAQALLLNRQKQEASWILTDFKRECLDRTTPVWGYYLYLCTLMEREESYVDRLTEEIEQIFHHYPDNSMLFWILLFVRDEYYRDSSRRWKAIEQWISQGNSSPYLYLEAYYLIWQDPYLLSGLNDFTLKILKWAAKQNAISKDIALQVRNLLPEQREYQKKWYPVLEKCYEADPSEEMVAAICTYLIRGQQFAPKYHIWYERGIDSEIRITNLYEAFLISMDQNEVTAIPKMIQLYFQYNSGLSYRHMAVLYVNIIAAKDKQPDVYHKYRRNMEQFAITQMEAGHMDDNLAVIYREILPVSILNTELAHKAAEILFVHKLSCDNRKIARAYILQKALKEPQIITLTNGCGYFKAYTREYTVILCDTDGNCFTDDYQDDALLQPENYLEKCMELAPEELPYLLYYFDNKNGCDDFSMEDGRYFRMLTQSERISEEYKAYLIPEIIRFYQKKGEMLVLEPYLAEVDIRGMSQENQCYVEEMLIETHQYERAFGLVQHFGYDRLGSRACVELCSYEITEHSFEDDDYLLGMAQSCFAHGKYNDVILIYLCKFFQGATKQMAAVWKAAGEFEIDTFDLEERIITQMLYSTDYVEEIDRIYDSYLAGGGRELVCMAYLSYFSHCYLVNDMMIPEHVFPQIRKRYLAGETLNDACLLGLLKRLSETALSDAADRKIVDDLLLVYTGKNIYFAFYKKFGDAMIKKYHLYDKFFLEYHTKPDQHVLLNFSLNGGEYHKEELSEVYDGIYVKMFVLLFGEAVSYYVSEKQNGEWKVMESHQIASQDIYGDKDQSRYELINSVMFAYAAQDEAMLSESMRKYESMDYAAKKLFQLL